MTYHNEIQHEKELITRARLEVIKELEEKERKEYYSQTQSGRWTFQDYYSAFADQLEQMTAEAETRTIGRANISRSVNIVRTIIDFLDPQGRYHLSAIALTTIIDSYAIHKGQLSMVQLSKKIGSAVERELQFQHLQLAADEETAAIARKFARREHSTPKYRHRATKHTTRRSSQRKGVNLLMDFGNEDKTRIGLYLLEVAAALGMVKFKNIRQGKKLTKIVFSLDLVERIDLNERILLARSYKSDPLIDVPKDWELTTEPGKSNTTGGYYLSEIRKRNPLLRNAVAGSIYGQKTIDTLNSLQRTAWRIDVRILEIANSLNEKRFKIGK